MRHVTRQLSGERACHGAPHPATGLILRRRVAGFYSAVDSRILFLGVTADGRIFGYASGADDPVSRELEAAGPIEQTGVFLDLTPLRAGAGNSRDALIAALRAIHLKEWIPSRKLGPNGQTHPYAARNGGGYTLEAELGISPNGYSDPDYLGWEVKQFGVNDFKKYRAKSPVTLMTPEPTGGIYRDEGVEAFMRRYGYPDKSGKEGRINFGGVYRAGGALHADTGLAMQISGYDLKTGKITDLDGGIAMVDIQDRIAAFWGLRGLMDHWNRKHAKAVYVPSLARNPPPEYYFGRRPKLCEGTDFLLLIRAVATGAVYLDPAVKMENADSGKPAIKRRNQFRVAHAALGDLYQQSEPYDLV